MRWGVEVFEEYSRVAANTKLSEVILEPVERTIKLHDDARFRVIFSLVGGLRDVFNPALWELAYEHNDIILALRYSIVLKKKRLGLPHTIAGPVKFLKEGRIYWTKDPRRGYRIWVIVVDEKEEPHFPPDVEEAKRLLFDFEHEIRVPGSKLERGESRVWAEVKLWWARHIYAEKAEVKGSSQEVVVRVV